MKKIWRFIISLLIPQFAAIIGSIFTFSAIPGWYQELQKASFNPPAWVFGPVWTLLYVLMGLALFIVWEKGRKRRDFKLTIITFAWQLILNLLWSVIFFGFKSPMWAFVEIIVLWVAIVLTMVRFRKISSLAAHLLLPYLLWVTFAAVLNLMIVLLN